jgi:hypothetical protein
MAALGESCRFPLLYGHSSNDSIISVKVSRAGQRTYPGEDHRPTRDLRDSLWCGNGSSYDLVRLKP